MSIVRANLRLTVAQQMSRNLEFRGRRLAIESTPWSQERLDKFGGGEMLRTGQHAIPTSLEPKRRAVDVFERGRFFVPAFHDVLVFTPIGIELAHRRVNWEEPKSIDELAKSVDHDFKEQIEPAAHELQLSTDQLYDLAVMAISVPDVSGNEKLSAFKILPSVLRRLGEMRIGSLSAQIVPLFRGVMESSGIYASHAFSVLPEALRVGFMGEQLFSLYNWIGSARVYSDSVQFYDSLPEILTLAYEKRQTPDQIENLIRTQLNLPLPDVYVRPAKEAAENILAEIANSQKQDFEGGVRTFDLAQMETKKAAEILLTHMRIAEQSERDSGIRILCQTLERMISENNLNRAAAIFRQTMISFRDSSVNEMSIAATTARIIGIMGRNGVEMLSYINERSVSLRLRSAISDFLSEAWKEE